MAFSESNASDDISLFLRQLLQRSSSPRPAPPQAQHPSIPSFPSFGPSSPLPPAPAPHSVKQPPPPQSFCFVSSAAASSMPVATGVTSGGLAQSNMLDGYYQAPSRSVAAEHSGYAAAGPSFSARYFPPGCGGSDDYMAVSASAVESESGNAGSGLMRSSENEVEDHDYESEEGAEPVMGGAHTQQSPPRSSSKRSRAAEVHNLSEKRRRSKINEKMKALQNLIPNSNKTDKASMLDEAIEYLKQLQLQVQMLSIRNGMSLHPMCLPGVSGLLHPSQLSQLGITFDTSTRDGPFLPDDPTTTAPPVVDHQAQHQRQQYAPPSSAAAAITTTVPPPSSLHGNMMINADSSFVAMDDSSSSSSTPNQLASFAQLPTPPPPPPPPQDGIREDDISYHQQSIINHRQPDRLEFKTGMMMMMMTPTPTPTPIPIPSAASKFGPHHHQSSDGREGSGSADQQVHLLASCSR